MRRAVRLATVATYLLVVVAGSNVISAKENYTIEWKPLFNGKNLDGWDTWLRAPQEEGAEKGEPLGLNNDPRKVFTVVDGKLRVSGEVFGCISSKEEYADYEIRWKYRWGEKKWPPRLNQLRDSGFLYHCYGKHGAFWNAWKACVEYQVQEGDSGDYYFLAGPRGEVRVADPKKEGYGKDYSATGELTTQSQRIVHSGSRRHRHGEWVDCHAIIRGDTSVHIVEGIVVNRAEKLQGRVDGKYVQLKKGHLQFQSEAAEIFYKDIELRDLPQGGSGEHSLETLTVSSKGLTITVQNGVQHQAYLPAIELIGKHSKHFELADSPLPVRLGPGEVLLLELRAAEGFEIGDDLDLKCRLESLNGPVESSILDISEGL
ncbi:MAG: DUF1080 domain-containing protein [Lacipirellulaceae bacterium]